MKKYIITILLLLATIFTYSQQQSVTTQGTEFVTAFIQNSSHSAGESGFELSLMVSAKSSGISYFRLLNSPLSPATII